MLGILRGLPIVDVLNMSTEVLKNQLIEFPQFQSLQQNDSVPTPVPPSDSNLNNDNSNSNDTSKQKYEGDRRGSMELQPEEVIHITARALEPLRMMGDIEIGILLFIFPSCITFNLFLYCFLKYY